MESLAFWAQDTIGSTPTDLPTIFPFKFSWQHIFRLLLKRVYMPQLKPALAKKGGNRALWRMFPCVLKHFAFQGREAQEGDPRRFSEGRGRRLTDRLGVGGLRTKGPRHQRRQRGALHHFGNGLARLGRMCQRRWCLQDATPRIIRPYTSRWNS